jgi:UDP-N-acetylglucosamine 2-epimerase (non-hydrolysing)
LKESIMKKVCVIFGTRPEAIKLAPVVLALKAQQDFECTVCTTGQHRQMLDQVLDIFAIRPDQDLAVMRPDQDLAGMTARLVEGLGSYLTQKQPDLVLVQGDTTTAFCAALVAFYNRIPVGHVEAGLRTGDMNAPWPEEANRVLVSRLAALHFAPTRTAAQNLFAENISPEFVSVTGNTVIDALMIAARKVVDVTPEIPGLPGDWRSAWAGKRLVLITGHRRESFGPAFVNICWAIRDLAVQFPDIQFVYPVHLNPNVRKPVHDILADTALANISLIEPLDYLGFVSLLKAATLVLTDSGGIQEEAPSLGKPALVMRDTTERPEAIEAGAAALVGTARESIVAHTTRLLIDRDAYAQMSRAVNPFGDGRAAERIVCLCRAFLRHETPSPNRVCA